ncbi:TonB-dependent receptor [Sphingobium xanthum]|uniref:TonB-dependent receptor n=2 Tax=Sphingobium TaxID=165695 RepID=UPI0015EC5600|nr:TonB-dependent receptor [Sphingobium xanthum]MCW2362172.1 iron complex outermembrane receptor protein [Sphingobium sp. B10D3B]MCW2401149.1 iron complex outermembrane receptor protein [Sphingobium sp. B10D7B]MCW2408129.1 iron complex outermembrane receptor protein [Sphingobium xanthum]
MSFSLRNKLLGMAGASVFAMSIAAPAQAQDDAAAQAQPQRAGVEEIVVTATRSATNLQETPLAITAVTANALTDRAINNIQDVAAIVPNASFAAANASFGRAVQAYIRGIGQYDFNLAFEPGVAFYVDDQYYALLAGSTFDLLDLERVEVLRGPQGTVFGRNAIGGAVNLISKAPDATPSAYVEATVGSYNRTDLRAGFNVPLSENLFFRVSGVSKKRKGYQKLLDFRCDMVRQGTPGLAGRFPSLDPSDGFLSGASQTDCELGRYGGESVVALRGALRYAGTGIDLTLSADYTNDDSPAVANKQLRIVPSAATQALDAAVYQPLWGVSYDSRFLTNSPYTTYATYCDPIPAGTNIAGTYYNGGSDRGGQCFDRKAVIENYGFSGKAVVDLTQDLTLTVLGSYRNVFTTAVNDTDGSPLSLQTTKSIITHEQWTVEPRLNYTSPLFDVTAGLFYYKGKGLTTSNVSIPFLNFQQNARISVDSEAKAAYAQAQVRPLDRLQLTAGLRYSEDTKDTLFNNGQGGIIRPVLVKDDRIDYRFGADYKLTDSVMVYGSIASGYRPGAFNPRPFQASQLVPVAAEEMVAYELGFKGDFFDRRLRLNVAGFYSDYSSRIVSQSGSECINNGTTGVCTLAGTQVDPAVTGGNELCRAYNPATDGAVNLAQGIGVACISKTNYVNSPGKVKGFEVELEARPVDGLTFNLAGGYTHFDAPELRNDPLVVNQTPVYVPQWTGSAGIQYEIPVEQLGGSITPRIDGFYQSKISFNSRSPIAQIPGRAVFNGRISYQNDAGDLTVAVGATNLFNKQYYYNIFDLVPFGQPTTEAQPGRPREWYLSVRKSF